MKRKSILLYFLIFLVILSCSTNIDFNRIIDNSKPFEIEKKILNSSNYLGYKRIINSQSKKWIDFDDWLKNNQNDWYKTPASYITEITIKQNDFNLLFFSNDEGETVVINYIDDKGNGKQYRKKIKKGELDFVTGNLKQIENISKYGELFDQKRHQDEPIKHLDIDDFKTYYDFKKEIENTLCNDSIPQIEMWSKNELKTFIPFDYCSLDYGCVRIRQRDIIEIMDNHFIENGAIYGLDSIYHLMKRKYLKKELTKYNPKPEKVYFQIIYKNDEKLFKLKELLKEVTKNYDSLKIENSLKIRFAGIEIVEQMMNEKTPHNNQYKQ